MSNELWTILVGASPVAEIRAAIPIAIGVFGFTPLKAYLLGLFGNVLPIIPLIFFLRKFSNYLMHHSYHAHQFLTWLFERTRLKHTQKFEAWGSVALFIFAAIPIPFTGVWTACVAAFVFGVDFGKAAFFISLGAAVAGLIVLAVIMGLISVNGLI